MKKTKTLVLYALLTAVIILMAFTPLGYLKTGAFEITFITVPVIVGAVMLGPVAGMILGGIFGLTSFMQCFGMSAFGMALLETNPVLCFITCFVPRLLMGLGCGLIFKAFCGKKTYLSCIIASLSGALLNTILFVGTLMLFYGNSEYINGLRGGNSIFVFLVAFVGLNGIIELIGCTILGTAVTQALLHLNIMGGNQR